MSDKDKDIVLLINARFPDGSIKSAHITVWGEVLAALTEFRGEDLSDLDGGIQWGLYRI